jgi:hypothetical protein
MEGFKKLAKGTQCFKEGGAVYKSRHSEKREMSEDIAQDKKIIKKAFAMHDKQEHKGDKTDLSKLKKGGRAKKDCGTVRKYKTGGKVENAYAAKKTDKDIKDIANTKRQKSVMLCGGKSVKKYSGEDGSYVESMGRGVKDAATKLKENIIGTPEQNRIGQEYMDKQAASGSKLAQFLGGKSDTAPTRPVPRKPSNLMESLSSEDARPVPRKPMMKKGGKAKKMNTGGTCS